MKTTKLMLLVATKLSLSVGCFACCGMCDYENTEVIDAQRQQHEVVTKLKRQQNRDVELAEYIAQQELAAQRSAAIAEQQRQFDDATRRKRNERADAVLAQRIARQELDEQQRVVAAAQQRVLDQAADKKRQEQRDHQLAQYIALQSLETHGQHAVAEQRDATIVQRAALQEFSMKELPECNDVQQVATDAMLAQQLQVEEFLCPIPQDKEVLTQRLVMLTSVVPAAAGSHELKNWARNNDVVPRSITPTDVLCAVCISTPQELEGTVMVKLPCKHVFCTACVKAMVAEHKALFACPLCREKSDASIIRSMIE